ncbi:hypothetical protein [Paenibacillus sp. FSL F4-0243]|uniref:hypothetical protein n=1 Tax=Paenibacillus sp. FSL F4-0243 TaxID=2954732 RepID=UPI0030DC5450
MRKPNERGSALVLVMFVALLLTILGLAVLGATVGGAQRTETRENDVQSLHLAQKGLDETAAYIQTKLDGRKDIDPDHMEDEIKDIVLEIKNKMVVDSYDVSTDLSGAGGTIKSIAYEKKDGQKYYINIAAEATVNGVTRQLKQQVVIDTYPDFLKYAFGSEGTLTLNGAPAIHGNIYAGEKLVISDIANYKYKGLDWLYKQTQYPRVEKNRTSAASTEPLPEVHVQSLERIEYSGNGVVNAAVNKTNASTILPSILGITKDQVFFKSQKKFIQINVQESFADKVVEATGLVGSKAEIMRAIENGSLGNFLERLPDANPPFIKPTLESNPTKEQTDAYNLAIADYEMKVREYQNKLLLNRTESAIYNSDLLIDGIEYKQLTFSDEAKMGTSSGKPKWLIVNGNLEINNYNSERSNFLNIQANILVTGNVTIRGQVKFNSTMFVLGTTTVEDAVIQGLGAKELVLISQGNVLINRIDAFSNPPEASKQDEFYMKAFFYTDSNADLYGVGSIFWLNGGFFAKKDLTVNAALGEVKEPLTPAEGFEDQESERYQMGHRFQIQYNKDVFTHQQSSLPRVQQVNVTVGPLELVSH